MSSKVAAAMAEGAAKALGADIGLGITGIAGPGGGSPEKPVGTVFIGVYTKGEVRVERYLFAMERWQVKLRSAHQALFLARESILGSRG